MTTSSLLSVSLLLLLSVHLRLASCEASMSMQSVPDLYQSMYKSVDGYPCVRLLNLSGAIGCSNPGRDKVVAPIVRYNNGDELAERSALLVSLDELPDLFTRMSDGSNFVTSVGGVLVEFGIKLQNLLKGFSPDEKFPQAQFAPYESIGYEWNPIGSGIMWKSYNVPVFLLSESGTKDLQEAAMKNENGRKSYTADVAEFDLIMQTTKAGTHDSQSCLKEETCLPLGGYSVLSLLPPLNISSRHNSKPIILTVASMDTASFFRDKSLGADSPISGLIALLAAVDALSHVDGLGDLSKQLAFGVFTGEAWGYLGSRRFVLELDSRSDVVSSLSYSQIEKVIEIGSVGKGLRGGITKFFAHSTGASPVMNETLAAFNRAQESLQSEHIQVSLPSASNPGIPPSSLMTFLTKNSSISGVVLEDFDASFENKFYHSHLDDLSNVNSSAIAAAASLVARTLYILASSNGDSSSSPVNSIKVNTSLVEELMGCLLSCEPGLSCKLVKEYISPSSTCPSHYVGVLIGEPSHTPYPGYINDVPRFVWNFLADRTSIPSGNGNIVCQQDCNNKDEVCIKSESGAGICVVSSTRYVPAYSTRLKYESGIWNVLPANSSDKVGGADPVWTESNWNTINLRIYTTQDTFYDRLVLFGGIAVTTLAYLGIIIVRAFIRKATKQD